MVRRTLLGIRLLSAGLLLSAMTSVSISAAREGVIDSDDRDYLRRQHAWFHSLSSSRQTQLRTLNEEFHQLDSESQSRLLRVMQNYNWWLSKLAADDRGRIESAPNSVERFKIVRELRELEWVRSLPKAQRDEFEKLPTQDRPAKIREWRAEEDVRHDEWSITSKNWEDLRQGRIPPILLADGRVQLDTFVANLRPALSDSERKALEDARLLADETGQFMSYAIEVVRLADAHPLLPGRVGAKDFGSLSEGNRDYLLKNDRSLVRKKNQVIIPNEENRELRKASGKWPEFALELAKHCEFHKLKLPEPLGDCERSKMPAEVQHYIDKILEPALKRTEKGREQWDALSRVSGKWPDYPKMLVEISKQNRLPIPGWSLPGPAQNWDRFRGNRMKPR